MRLFESDWVCIVQSQADLDNTFGPGKFAVVLEEVSGRQRFFVEAHSNVSTEDINLAQQVMANEVARALSKIKARAPEKLQDIIDKTIENTQRKFTSQDAKDASTWLGDQTRPCPGCVLYVAALNNVTQQEAANIIIQDQNDFEQKYNAMRDIMFTCLAEIVPMSDLQDIRQKIREADNRIRNY